MEVNEEKRKKFMEFAGKRVNNVMHDIQILEPMARSNAYEEKARAERKVFSFDSEISMPIQEENVTEENIENNIQEF